MNPKSATVLYLHYSLGHYTLLLPKGGKLPAYIPQDDAGPVASQSFAPRGGGKRRLVQVAEQGIGPGAVDDSWIPAHVNTDAELAPRKVVKRERTPEAVVCKQEPRVVEVKREPSRSAAVTAEGRCPKVRRGIPGASGVARKAQGALVKVGAGKCKPRAVCKRPAAKSTLVKSEPRSVCAAGRPATQAASGVARRAEGALVKVGAGKCQPRAACKRPATKGTLVKSEPHSVCAAGRPATQVARVKPEPSAKVQCEPGSRGASRVDERHPEAEHWSTVVARKRAEHCRTPGGRYGWTCNVCHLRLTSGEYEKLRFLRSNHISRNHKGMDRRLFARLAEPRRPIGLVSDCESPSWMCWHCGLFLPPCQRRVRANSIAQHIRDCEACPLGWTPLQNLCVILEDHGIATLGVHQAVLARRFRGIDLSGYRPLQFSCKQEPSKGYIHKLTEDGDIESQPGPSGLHLLSWNTQGFSNLAQAVQLDCFAGWDVIHLQEPNLSKALFLELTRMGERKGFHAYGRCAEERTDAVGRYSCRGGLVTLVRHGLPSFRVGDRYLEGEFECLSVSVGGCLFHNWHRKPAGDLELYQATVSDCLRERGPAVAVGDHNADFASFSCDHGCKHAALDELGVPRPTRVGGRRCIDFGVSSGGYTLCELELCESTIGDHFMYGCSVQGSWSGSGGAPLLRAKPTTQYLLPESVSAQEWTQLQADVWTEVLAPPDGQLSTEQEWSWFNAQAELAMRQATTACGAVLRDPPGRRPKGSGFEVQVQAAGARGSVDCQSCQLKRLMKLQGRLREWQRQTGIGRDTSAVQANVMRSWLPRLGGFPHDVGEALAVVAQGIADAQQERTRASINRWKQDLAKRGKEASRWLKGKGHVATRVAPHDAAEDAPAGPLSVGDSLGNLRDFWRGIWDRPSCDHAAAVSRWQQHGRRHRFSGRASSLWEPAALHAAARAKPVGGAGPCGWSGQETSTWPARAWEIYSQLVDRWMRRGVFPRAWSQVRQVHLPKEESSAAEAHVRADKLRPIVVMSILWRIVSSAAASHEKMQRWVQRVVEPEQCGGIRGRHAHHGLGRLCQSFQKGAVLTSLDLEKCFDHVHPNMVLRILEAAGFPKSLTAAMAHAWSQERFLEVSGYVLGEAQLVHSSMPQGDGLSPLALNVLLAAPSTEARHLRCEEFEQSIFLDDRAFTAKPDDVPRLLRHWASWSESFGLKENCRKQAIVTRCATAAQRLRDLGLGHLLRGSARVLGVDFTDSFGGQCPTAETRLATALQMGRKLIHPGIPVDIRRDLWRTRVIPKASWGHLLKPIPLEIVKEFRTLFKRVTYGHRMGHNGLRAILEGHGMELGFMAGMHALRTWRASGAAQDLLVRSTAGSWFGTVCGFLVGLGWRREGGGIFSTASRRIDCVNEAAGSLEHKIRAQWRQQLHEDFVQAERRDSRALRLWNFSEAQVRKAIPMYQMAGSDCKAVMLGAAHSTAFYQKRKFGQVAQSCPWCGARAAPDWDHLAWQCNGMPGVEDRPPAPLHAPQRRLGWPDTGECSSVAARRLRWLGSVREAAREQLGRETEEGGL